MARYPTLLLLGLLAAAAISNVADCKKDRGEALDAAKGKKPKVPRDQNPAPGSRQKKREDLAACINTAASTVGGKRRRGDSPGRLRIRKDAIIAASSTCINATDDACTPVDGGNSSTAGNSSTIGNSSTDANSSDTGSGRRLQELLAVDPRALSDEESRHHLRALLQAADDDDFIPTAVDLEDEDDEVFMDGVAEQLSPNDIDDYCAVQQDQSVQVVVQAYITYSRAEIAAQGAKGTVTGHRGSSSILWDNQGRRIPLREHFARMRAQQAKQAANVAAKGLRAMSQPSDCRVGTGVTAMKDSTVTRVICNSTTGLASSIIPAYPTDNPDLGFTTAVRNTPGGFLLPTQSTPGEDPGKRFFKEYSDANEWGNLFTQSSISQTTINSVEKVLTAFSTACDGAGQFYVWVGFGGGTDVSPGSILCKPLGLVTQLVLLALRLGLVDVARFQLGAGNNHDLILQTAEVEATGENVITNIHNGKVIYKFVGASAQSTQKLVQEKADATAEIIQKVKNKIKALESRLTALVQERSCNIQNAVANTHNTANHVQRLLLVPQGTRPGFQDKGNPALFECFTSTPAACQSANSTTPVRAATVCNPSLTQSLIGATPLSTAAIPTEALAAGATADLTDLTPLPMKQQKAVGQGRTRRISP